MNRGITTSYIMSEGCYTCARNHFHESGKGCQWFADEHRKGIARHGVICGGNRGFVEFTVTGKTSLDYYLKCVELDGTLATEFNLDIAEKLLEFKPTCPKLYTTFERITQTLK